jgi:hypothetical protein
LIHTLTEKWKPYDTSAVAEERNELITLQKQLELSCTTTSGEAAAAAGNQV